MIRVSIDQNGESWDIRWGVTDPEGALRETFGLEGAFRSTGNQVAFQDPRYSNETKVLHVYECESAATVAMGEITPSVYAAGVKK